MTSKREFSLLESCDTQTDSISGSSSFQRGEKKGKSQRSPEKSVSSVSSLLESQRSECDTHDDSIGHNEKKGKVYRSPEKTVSSVSSLFESKLSDKKEKADYLNDLFEDIKSTVSPKKSDAGSPMKPPRSPKILVLTFVLQTFKGFMVAIAAKGPGTFHIHKWFKGNGPISGVDNTFGKGIFLSDISHSRNCARGNYKGVPSLNPGAGTWYLISARDQKEIFIEQATNLERLWTELKPHLQGLKSMEHIDDVLLDVKIVEEEVSKELFHELSFVYYNTLKSP
jgi:hypothetical protein